MEHFFSYIEIENFKSIKKLRIDGCKRINLFIGAPNTGKSNIIEALSIFSLPYYRYSTPKRLDNFLRLNPNQIPELYYNGNYSEPIFVKTQNIKLQIDYQKQLGFVEIKYEGRSLESDHIKADAKLYLRNGSVNANKKNMPIVKRYIFNLKTKLAYSNLSVLLPPFGNNLAGCIEEILDIKEFIKTVIANYNLIIRYDKSSENIKFIKRINENEELEIAYNLIADTLQRMIFYKTAVHSNKDSILLFEEPEANCYPPYILELTQDIIGSKTNQFFIATHSPVILNEFLDEAFDDVAIYLSSIKDGQTVLQLLTTEQKNDIVTKGIDVFFNSDYFLESI